MQNAPVLSSSHAGFRCFLFAVLASFALSGLAGCDGGSITWTDSDGDPVGFNFDGTADSAAS